MGKRVVITGLGAITSIGSTIAEMWENLLAGRSGISPVEHFDLVDFPFDVKNGGEIKRRNLSEYDNQYLGMASKFALHASKECVADSGLIESSIPGQRVGVVFGTTLGEAQELEKLDREWQKGFGTPVSRDACYAYMPYLISQSVAKKYKFYGPNYFLPNACSAGNFSIAKGYELITSGMADAIIAGGSDCFNKRIFSGFARVGAISPDYPRPFCRDRSGMIPAEGAGALMLEDYDQAVSRGAKIYAEIIGYGYSCDAHHITQPDPEGVERSYRSALKSASLIPEQVDFISAHGTGTKANDATEVTALRKVFGELLERIPVNSIKSMIGHAMGAASALEAIMSVLVIKHGMIPPTTNVSEIDPVFGNIHIVSNRSMKKEVNVAFETASGFGGNNCVVIFRKV
jgi:3-oxoacyl-[acyl-carrier-protein] synthase II